MELTLLQTSTLAAATGHNLDVQFMHTLTSAWDCIYVAIICATVIIVISIVAFTVYNILKTYSNVNNSSVVPVDNKKAEPSIEELKALEDKRHANQMDEINIKSEEERKTLDDESKMIKGLMDKALVMHNSGLNVSIEHRQRGNIILISTTPSDESQNENHRE